MLFGKYIAVVEFHDNARLPAYKGSTLRGGFGAALKMVMCGMMNKACDHCRLSDRCLYARTFEPQGKTLPGARVASPPHPYVIEPPLDGRDVFTPGDRLAFGLVLFGAANTYLPFFFHAVSAMGRRGIGKSADGRATFSLVDVRDARGNSIYDPDIGQVVGACTPVQLDPGSPGTSPDGSAEVTVRFETPLRLKYMNHLHAGLTFEVLTRAMLRRISQLFAFHGDGEPPLDYKGLVARAREVRTASSALQWRDWERYSNRQQARMCLGGIAGSATYQDVPPEFQPLLAIARLVHIGKQTTFGLGLVDYDWGPERGA